MKPAADAMKEKINNTDFNKPNIDIISNVNAESENDPDKIKKLIDQIFSTVKWRDTLIYMSKNGIQNFIEIGPGKALTGMVKRTIKEQIPFQSIQLLILKIYKMNLKAQKSFDYWCDCLL